MRIYQGENPVGSSGKSAYQYAVDGGYQGTEAEFCELLAGIENTASQDELTSHISDTNNPHGVTASQVGAIPIGERGAVGGIATLDATGKVPSGQLPEISSVHTYTATIGTTWTETADTGVKTQTVSFSGITAANTAKLDHAYTGSGTSDDYAAFVEAENQFLTYITNGFAETVEGGIQFTIFGDANTVEIPVVAEVS